MNVARFLQEQARARPAAAAIIDRASGEDRVLTFAELERTAAQAVAMLKAAGLRPGDTVLFLQPMSAELYCALAAIFRLSLVAMFLDPSMGREHIERSCRVRPPDAFIGSPASHLLRLLSPRLRGVRRKFSVGWGVPGAECWERLRGFPEDQELESCGPETPALLTFTSGSTGAPKAVVRTHGFLAAQHRVIADSFELAAGQINLTTLPIFVLSHLAAGVTSVIPDADLRRPDAVDPRPILRQIDRWRPNRCVASPAFLGRLIEGCAAQGRRLDTFEKVHTGGGPVFPRLLRELERTAPSAEIVAVYGSTEAEPIAHVASRDFEAEDVRAMLSGRGLLAGSPVPQVTARIVRDRWGSPLGTLAADAFGAMTLPPGQTGEIVVAGDHVGLGYLNGEGDEESKFKVDGTVWHRTGDAGYFDERGRLWLVGRCAAKVSDRHGTLFPFSVECAAQDFPFVSRAAFDSLSGRRVLAVQTKGRGSLKPEEAASLKRSLAWAHVSDIRVLKAIPMDKRHNAKVDYPALRALLRDAA